MKLKFVHLAIGILMIHFVRAQDPIIFGGLENRNVYFQDSAIIAVHLDAPFIIYAESQGSYVTSEALPLFFTINEDTTTAIYSPSNHTIRVFPNPTHDQVIIERNDPSGNWLIFIHDGNGRLVRKVDWPDAVSSYQFSVNQLTPGMYVISLKDEEGISLNRYKLLKL